MSKNSLVAKGSLIAVVAALAFSTVAFAKEAPRSAEKLDARAMEIGSVDRHESLTGSKFEAARSELMGKGFDSKESLSGSVDKLQREAQPSQDGSIG